jgi:hypothetical protein
MILQRERGFPKSTRFRILQAGTFRFLNGHLVTFIIIEAQQIQHSIRLIIKILIAIIEVYSNSVKFDNFKNRLCLMRLIRF